MESLNLAQRNNRIIFIAFLTTLCAVSCTERIDINTDASAPRLVIYGCITTDTMQHAISITRSSGYFATTKPQGISNALITISDGYRIFTLTESAAEAGVYLTDADVYGIEGQNYTLNVSLDFDNDGQEEQYSATSYLPHAARLDSIRMQTSTDYDDEIEISIFGGLSIDKDCYYSFHAFRNDVPLNDSLSLFALFDGSLVGTDTMDDVACYFLDQTKDKTKLASGDRITLQLNVLTQEYGLFLLKAQTEVLGSVPLLSGPPANVETNILGANGEAPANISGYFSAYSGKKCSTVWK